MIAVDDIMQGCPATAALGLQLHPNIDQIVHQVRMVVLGSDHEGRLARSCRCVEILLFRPRLSILTSGKDSSDCACVALLAELMYRHLSALILDSDIDPFANQLVDPNGITCLTCPEKLHLRSGLNSGDLRRQLDYFDTCVLSRHCPVAGTPRCRRSALRGRPGSLIHLTKRLFHPEGVKDGVVVHLLHCFLRCNFVFHVLCDLPKVESKVSRKLFWLEGAVLVLINLCPQCLVLRWQTLRM
mmetsp:Transcript_67873/g.151594  ORF Transcript_67873/g.151594 Transcript_67873/m.151594 type:complete len:242 (-) Transcript_67873:40-765(-)